MGTHPIFESDFDCLTEFYERQTEARESKSNRWQDIRRQPRSASLGTGSRAATAAATSPPAKSTPSTSNSTRRCEQGSHYRISVHLQDDWPTGSTVEPVAPSPKEPIHAIMQRTRRRHHQDVGSARASHSIMQEYDPVQ